MFQKTIDVYNEWYSAEAISGLGDFLGAFSGSSGSYLAIKANNNSDVLVAGMGNSAIEQCRAKLVENFMLNEDEYIFWVKDTSFWKKRNQGCVVTDWGISLIKDNDMPNVILKIDWKSVERVEYKKLFLYFYDSSAICEKVRISDIFNKEDYPAGDDICKLFNQLAQSRHSKELSQIEECFKDKDFLRVIQLCDDSNELDKAKVYRYKALANKCLGLDCVWKDNDSEEVVEKTKCQKSRYLKEALKNLNYLNSYYEETPSWLYLQKADVMSMMPYGYCSNDIFYEARRFAIASLSTDAPEDCEAGKKLIELIDKYVFKDFEFYKTEGLNSEDQEYANSLKFTNNKYIPSADRQFLILSKNIDKLKGYYDSDENIKWVFPLNRIPSDVHFDGFPQPDTLYIAHPGKPDLYIPYEKAEDYLYDDKIREFEYLMNCLGATEVNYKWEQGRRMFEEDKSTTKIGVEGDLKKAVNFKADGKGSSLDTSENASNIAIGRSHKSDPQNYPCVPNDLVWYPFIDSWQIFAKDRLNNNKLEYEYTFKSSEVSNLSSNRKLEINASFKKLMLKVKGSYSNDKTTTSKNSEETIWSVKVKFKPLSEFKKGKVIQSIPQSVGKDFTLIDNGVGLLSKISSYIKLPWNKDSQLSDVEQYYLEEVKDAVADGKISVNDRKRLERRRLKLGISEERARELEGTIKPQFTDDEQDYYEEMLEVLEDGVIDEKERKSLERLLKRMDISRERANEIENFVKKKKGLK